MIRTLRRVATLGVALGLGAAFPHAARAEVGIHGFVEGAAGVRTAESDIHTDQDWILRETRAQIRLDAYGDQGEAFVRLDVVQDQLLNDDTEVELREGWLRFTFPGDRVEVKAGRQALTWGTGDLVFINDRFSKDWESFFAGREDAYLKTPTDALRLGVFGLPMSIDLVLIPEHQEDRLPRPLERFSIPTPALPPIQERPTALENTVGALRLTRYVGNFDVALYGYRGFFNQPLGLDRVNEIDPDFLVPYYPELSVYGASARGSLLGGVTWVEGGWYDSREDRDGDDPLVPNSSLQWMLGHERQVAEETNVTAQWFAEWMQDHEAAEEANPGGVGDELRHLVTLRIEKWLRYHTVRVSLMGFVSPTDEDALIRPLVAWKPSDELELALGANVFEGDDPTPFGAFDADDNVYVRLRYGF